METSNHTFQVPLEGLQANVCSQLIYFLLACLYFQQRKQHKDLRKWQRGYNLEFDGLFTIIQSLSDSAEPHGHGNMLCEILSRLQGD